MGFADVNFAIFSLFITPLIVFLSIVIFLAAVGKTVGVRYLYIKALILIFEVRQIFTLKTVHTE